MLIPTFTIVMEPKIKLCKLPYEVDTKILFKTYSFKVCCVSTRLQLNAHNGQICKKMGAIHYLGD